MQSVNESFKNALENKYYMSILYKICNKNLKSVCTVEEIRSVAMSTLWNCVSKYKDGYSAARFSSYLYKSAENNSRRLYKKKIKIKNIETELTPYQQYKKQDNDIANRREVFEILESVKDLDLELYDILVKKFYYNMTNKEIGIQNGYGKETARKKVKKALDLCRKIVYN